MNPFTWINIPFLIALLALLFGWPAAAEDKKPEVAAAETTVPISPLALSVFREINLRQELITRDRNDWAREVCASVGATIGVDCEIKLDNVQGDRVVPVVSRKAPEAKRSPEAARPPETGK